MEEKNFYDYLLICNKQEVENEPLIQKLFGITQLKLPTNNCLSDIYKKDSVINTGLKTWNSEIINLRYIYAQSLKYHKSYKDTEESLEKEAYEYWCRKNLESTIQGLVSLYDKSLHILNGMYNLKQEKGFGFEDKIFSELEKSNDNNIKSALTKYQKMQKTISLYKPNRNSSVHNYSQIFPAFEVEKGMWKYRQGISIKEAYRIIEDIVNNFEQFKNVIEAELTRIFSKT